MRSSVRLCDHNVLPDDPSFAGKEIENAWWETGPFKHFHHQGTTNRGLFCRLHDHRIPRNERGGNHSCEYCHWKIPRRDDEGDPARPVMLIVFFPRHVLGESRPTTQPHLLSVEEEEINRFPNITICFRPSFSDFEDFDGAKFKAPTIHDGSHPFEDCGAIFDADAPPMFEGLKTCADSSFCLRNSGFCDRANNLFRRARVDGINEIPS